jgi:hypothetical protein
MNRSRKAGYLALVLLLMILAWPSTAQAGSLIGFRNDTDGPIIVQGMSVINGQVRQGKRLTIQPGGIAWDVIAVPGNKLITVVDGKQPTKTLLQQTVQCGGRTLFFAIQPVKKKAAAPTKTSTATKKAPNTPKFELAPATPPTLDPMGMGKVGPAPRR